MTDDIVRVEKFNTQNECDLMNEISNAIIRSASHYNFLFVYLAEHTRMTIDWNSLLWS